MLLQAVLAGGLSASEVDEVILVGGCSRIPAVRAMLHGVFGADKQLCTAVNPDEAVAQGAAIRHDTRPTTDQLAWPMHACLVAG